MSQYRQQEEKPPSGTWWVEFVGGPDGGKVIGWPFPSIEPETLRGVNCRGEEYAVPLRPDGGLLWEPPRPDQRNLPAGARVVKLRHQGKVTVP